MNKQFKKIAKTLLEHKASIFLVSEITNTLLSFQDFDPEEFQNIANNWKPRKKTMLEDLRHHDEHLLEELGGSR